MLCDFRMHQLLVVAASDHSNSKAGLDSWGGFQASAWWIRDMRSGLVLRLVVFGSLLRSVVPGLGGGSVALVLIP